MIAEYLRYLIDHAGYYYPAMLPEEMLEEKSKIGEVDQKLWIALEDLQDGWLKFGSVGQEVYGAGNAFGILPRHYLKVPEEGFMIYVDYPTSNYTARKGTNIHFEVLGDARLSCRLMIVKTGSHKLPKISVSVDTSDKLQKEDAKSGNMAFIIRGNSKVIIRWKH